MDRKELSNVIEWQSWMMHMIQGLIMDEGDPEFIDEQMRRWEHRVSQNGDNLVMALFYTGYAAQNKWKAMQHFGLYQDHKLTDGSIDHCLHTQDFLFIIGFDTHLKNRGADIQERTLEVAKMLYQNCIMRTALKTEVR